MILRLGGFSLKPPLWLIVAIATLETCWSTLPIEVTLQIPLVPFPVTIQDAEPADM